LGRQYYYTGKGSVLFWGEISPNFDLNNMISNYAKDFSWRKKVPYSPDFEGKTFQIARF
jgi:hypothetical protein